VISPLLANIVLDALDKKARNSRSSTTPGWSLRRRLRHTRALHRRPDTESRRRNHRWPRAEDQRGEDAHRQALERETLNFLGYAMNMVGKSGRVALRPSEKAQKKLKERLREIISRQRLYKASTES
jgi:hypothetical protein